mgnify:CR=1 FL=1
MWRIWPIVKIFGVFLLTVVFLVALLFAYFNLPGPEPREDVELGVTFSYRYAENLGLDWKETYTAILDDIGVRKLRIPVYWDGVETEKGAYDFSAIDWQLEEAKKRDAEVILSIGQRVPRWPECHIPAWVEDNGDETYRETRLLSFMEKTVERYRNHSEITTWQVENEPFLVFFGECPQFRRGFLDEEIAFVRKLDPSRPILLTDSGELSTWYPAAKRGDMFGTTMYRKIHKPGIGYYTYPIGPNFFRFKEKIVRLLTNQERFIVIELQAEPWANGWVGDASLQEQFRTMDEHQLRDIVTYAKRVRFPEVYLWGAEWWYWLKEKKDYPAVWETAREIFRGSRGSATAETADNR